MNPARYCVRPPWPYSLARTAARFARYPERVDLFDGATYRRLIDAGPRPALLAVTQLGPPSRPVLEVRLRGSGARSRTVRREADRIVARSLGAGIDLRPFYGALRTDALLGPSLRACRGLSLAGWPGPWEALVSTILCQQVNLRFAYAIRADLVAAFGPSAEIDGARFHAFPLPAHLAGVPATALRRFRLSAAKAGAIARAADAFAAGELSEAELERLPDAEVVARLTRIKGIGTWTAETVLLRGLGRLDAFPAGDLGIVKHLARGLLDRPGGSTEPEMRRWAEAWRPFRGLALVYAYAELRRRAGGRG